jgi:hypothetical protein
MIDGTSSNSLGGSFTPRRVRRQSGQAVARCAGCVLVGGGRARPFRSRKTGARLSVGVPEPCSARSRQPCRESAGIPGAGRHVMPKSARAGPRRRTSPPFGPLSTVVRGLRRSWRGSPCPVVERPLEPVIPEELAGVRRTDGAVAARQIVRGAVSVAAPAHALGILRSQWQFRHVSAPSRRPRTAERRECWMDGRRDIRNRRSGGAVHRWTSLVTSAATASDLARSWQFTPYAAAASATVSKGANAQPGQAIRRSTKTRAAAGHSASASDTSMFRTSAGFTTRGSRE